jgi:HK97 family phage prohead protease
MLAASMRAEPRTVDLAPLDRRADVGTINDDARTAELVFSTGADVLRYDWMSGKRYIERLSMKPSHVRLDRLNSGAPLLDSHSAYSIANQIGVVEDNSARISNGRGVASVRFPKAEDDPDADRIYRKVKDRIIRNVSVGYRVHRFEETQGKTEIPIRVATDWEPFEISMVPMGADNGAKMRSSKEVPTNPCLIVTMSMSDEDRIRRFRLAIARARVA